VAIASARRSRAGRRRGSCRPPTAVVALVLSAAVTLLDRPPAAARARGITSDSCEGCHGSGATAQLTLTADPPSFRPGDAITLTLVVAAPSIRVGGTFIATNGVGTLRVVSGEGLMASSQGLTHTAPKPAQNGTVTFRFGWQAPTTPGNVSFRVAALAGNGSNTPAGDTPGWGTFEWVYGCAGRTYIQDNDRDGYGSRVSGTLLACDAPTAPIGFATTDGDCNDNDETTYPSAPEICNRKDDNCDGAVDEDAPPVMLWPDADGDGYYATRAGTPKVGCGAVPGYAVLPGDCNDNDETTYPSAPEICNLKDDNCDNRVDERVRPQCGLGWCVRNSLTCDLANCTPAEPQPELCNLIDDDCDGDVDEGSCAPGMICLGSECVPAGDAGEDGSPSSGVDAGDGGGGGAGGGGAHGPTGGCGCAVTPRAAPAREVRAAAPVDALAALAALLAGLLRRRPRGRR
jgi:hypothetical protein